MARDFVPPLKANGNYTARYRIMLLLLLLSATADLREEDFISSESESSAISPRLGRKYFTVATYYELGRDDRCTF